MATGDDMLRMFNDLGERMAEASAERANLRDTIKEARRLVPEMVEKQVREYLAIVEAEVRDAMHEKIESEIAKLMRELRDRLGFSAPGS